MTEKQRSWRYQGDSTVALVRCESYEETIWSLLKGQIKDLPLPSLKNKRVLIKPNIVEFRPDRPVTTNPAVIEAAVSLADFLGAKEILVAEGPGHFRDTQFLLEATGIGNLLKKLGLEFVDLNLDRLEHLDNADGLSGLTEIFLPRSILAADAIISVPKLKTHHWAGMTASMKNLFGIVPGRKYGWPKNALHWAGIEESVMDLLHLARPAMGLVDAVVAMEGDGPISGRARQAGFVALSTDVAALDATCARAMGMKPESLKIFKLALQVAGNVEAAKITLVGTPLADLTQNFDPPPTFKDKDLALDPGSFAS